MRRRCSRSIPDALVIDVKLRDGTVTYQTSVDGGQYVTVGNESSLENLRTLLQSDRWTVARISALADHAYAKARRDETALRREDGGLWYDYDSMCWLDPNKPETQQYLADLCAECASLGFDEILLDQFTYPTVGRLDRLQTGRCGEDRRAGGADRAPARGDPQDDGAVD